MNIHEVKVFYDKVMVDAKMIITSWKHRPYMIPDKICHLLESC